MLHPSMGELHRLFVTTVIYLVEVELPGGVGVELVGQWSVLHPQFAVRILYIHRSLKTAKGGTRTLLEWHIQL